MKILALFTATWTLYEAALPKFQLVPVVNDSIDLIWTDSRPPRPNRPLMVHDVQFAGSLLLIVCVHLRMIGQLEGLPCKRFIVLCDHSLGSSSQLPDALKLSCKCTRCFTQIL